MKGSASRIARRFSCVSACHGQRPVSYCVPSPSSSSAIFSSSSSTGAKHQQPSGLSSPKQPSGLSSPTMAPNRRLASALAGKDASVSTIKDMVSRIRDPDYSLREFFDDSINAFPELGLFFDGSCASLSAMSTSGLTAETEYQRTIGALFAVYWLLRLHEDGKVSFCYGVNEDWEPCTIDRESLVKRYGTAISDKLFVTMSSDEKRWLFMETVDWTKFSELVDQAGCGRGEGTDFIMALLCFTSFHDIMKLDAFLPTVQSEHAPYAGHKVGEVIRDHDVALAYVLEFFPDLIPSFSVLPEASRKLVLFAQTELHFNHGWFVQAEAPPGAMLSKFKEVLSKGVAGRNIGFYFLHWLTDLAGAEATPLAGAEKFVLRFPHKVLKAFLWSMPYVFKLAELTETEVAESYLEQRWLQLAAQLPRGPGAIAKMRLAIMAQAGANAGDVLDLVTDSEWTTLEVELARTGVAGQYYTAGAACNGPALLMYYAPAFLQQAAGCRLELGVRVSVLARVLHAARKLWPATKCMEGVTVVINLGELKIKHIDEVVRCPANESRLVWILVRENNLDGSVILRRPWDLNTLSREGTCFRLLDFGSNCDIDADSSYDDI